MKDRDPIERSPEELERDLEDRCDCDGWSIAIAYILFFGAVFIVAFVIASFMEGAR